VRIFFAFWPNVEERQKTEDLARSLPLPERQFVRPENLHMTLAFVGEVPASDLSRVSDLASSCASESCALTLNHLEWWPQARVIVAVARDTPPAASRLATSLRAALGLRDERPLRPHVTLARNVSQNIVLPEIRATAWDCRAFSLARSDPSRDGTAYTVLRTWPLLYKP
jgi:2'-5' RNA ligase